MGMTIDGDEDGSDDDDYKKGSAVGGIRVDKPREICHVHSEHPSGGEPGTGLGCVGPA